MKKYIGIIFILVIGICVFYFVSKNEADLPMQKRTRYLMDTYCTIQIPGNVKVTGIIDKALDKVEEINKKFNMLNPESPLYDFNNNNIPIKDKELVDLIKIALEVSKKSEGAFDITVTPLVRLWGFYGDIPKDPKIPQKSEIKKCLKKVGYKNLIIKDDMVTKINKDIEIDLGAIAKGYAVGECLKILKDAGVKSAIIDLGHDIYALGKLNGKSWRVGINNPRGKGVIGVFEISDLSVVTSGDYERFFEKNGIKYNHIINPKNGYPAKEIISSTIITPDATMADALSTAVFVLGKDEGLKMIEKIPKTEAVIITGTGEVLCSLGLKENFKIAKKGGNKNEK